MKSLFCVLIFSQIFNACEESLYDKSGLKENYSKIHYPADQRSSILTLECPIINDWLNRESMSHFLNKQFHLDF